MMRPLVVKIGGREIRVSWIDEKEWRKTKSLPNRKAGAANWGCGEIWIRVDDDTFDRWWYRETLVHEIFHLCFTYAGYDALDGKLGHTHEERLVTILAPLWLQCLNDSPGLLEYLTLD